MDFSKCKTNPLKIYGGANGNKIGIIYNDENYMLKFPSISKLNKNLHYTNSSISEHISCEIISSLGINVQKTILGKYNDKIVVACKDFETKGYKLRDFASLKNTIIDSEHNGYGTDIEDILQTINEQQLIDKNKLTEYFWDLFVIDAFLGNFDRHNGNWGFLINEEKQDVKLAPIYDCGSCLYPQADEIKMKESLESDEKMEDRIFSYPTSALKQNDIKINYYNFLMEYENDDLTKSLNKISSKIDFIKIYNIIQKITYITPIHKCFIYEVLQKRYEKILLPSLEKKLSVEKKKELLKEINR